MKNKKTNYLWMATDRNKKSFLYTIKPSFEKTSGNFWTFSGKQIYIGTGKSKPGTCQKVRLEIVK